MSRRAALPRFALGIAWYARRAVAVAWTGAAVIGFTLLLFAGAFTGLWAPSRRLWPLACALGLGALVIVRLAAYLSAGGSRTRRYYHQTGSDAPAAARAELKTDLELGAVLLVGAFAVVQATGGAGSPVYPLVYALISFLVAFHRLAVGVPLVGLALTLELALYHAGGGAHGDARALLVGHALFLVFFALMNALFLQAEMLRRRRAHDALLASEVTRMRDEARDFRLISSQLGADSRTRPRAEEEEKLAQGAVETIHQALYYNLELLKKSLSLHTCVLLWLDDTGEKLRIKELVTDADCIAEGSIPADAGAVGTVIKSRSPLRLEHPKAGHLPWYAGPVAVSELVAVPVLEEGHLRGVLAADRLPDMWNEQRPGTGALDAALLAGTARQIVRCVQSERVFSAVERAKYEHERFYTASALLNRALTPDEVYATAFEAAREICDFDFAAVTRFEKDGPRHVIVAVSGDAGGDIAGQVFTESASLVAMVVKNRHYLPAGGELRDKDIPVFTRRVKLRGMESLLVLPLICADEPVGTFVLASARPHFFGKDKREMLGVIANQVAVSTRNAEMYRAMEEMATTDGLTGLVNHRTFQVRTADLLSRADRQGGRLALLLTDIDHFKKVNDTYGHPTGDQVLKKVAAVCRGQVRKIDIAARYGGEEFAIVLDGTDLTGARGLAERIRAEVEKQQFNSDKGPFRCTLSLGIAAYPDDGRDVKTLIAHADQALYHAKHNGRNRAVAWPDLSAAPQLPSQPRLKAVAGK